MPTLIRELIDIPEQVHRGDFVLRLTEGVTHPRETLRDYVVTEELAACFDDALGFIRSALESRSSKAAYLHGSFGSGKSHFMAVLHLLLQHNADARSIAALAPVVAKHGGWLEGKRFLLVPYHMIGARSMESAVLGHYAEHVHRVHPGAPTPGVYLAERLFDNARSTRQRMADEAFFAALNADKGGGGGGWGAIGAAWDAPSFEAALHAPPRSEERARLVGDLVTHLFPVARDVAAAGEEGFVPLDDGLAIISKHAQALGYDAVILFLDELILWLASHVADLAFVSREGQKLTKLVEATTPDRPIPLVSFVARQRDLRELVGDHVPGAEKLGFLDVLKYWEGRFHQITLEDRNLPAIAEKRVLRPRSEAARQMLDRAFEETKKAREEVMRVLLTTEADQRMFRAVYPFSPALVQTLVAVSSVLQRERTALKVMLQLLVNQRDSLAVGDLVPVGDLFDVIAEGDEPFTEDMRIHFENAKRLYHQKLRPLVEKDHGMRAEEVQRIPASDSRAAAFRADDRLLKTLLLAALVPEVESLKGMTAGRLAALNHGTIRSPIPGREGQIVLGKCRAWASQVGEIKIGDDPTNPTIAIQITGVDTQAIVGAAIGHDNLGNRRLRVRQLLFAQLGVHDRDDLFLRHEFTWRGTRRAVEVVFANVREVPDESLRAKGADWKVVIDWPFDEGHGPRDDIARLDQFRSRGETSRTVCWVPGFFSQETLADLGTLVILEHVLAGERFRTYAAHLSQVDQAAARSLLDNQRSQLQQRIVTALEAAYGVLTPPRGIIDPLYDPTESLQSLDPAFQPSPPVGANLAGAFQHLLGQMLAAQYPAHPEFGTDIRPAALRRIHQEAQRATQAKDGRIVVEREQRQVLRDVANPLRLGEMHEDAFILGRYWRDHFLREAGKAGGPVTVAKLRLWTDEPQPAGLTKEVQNLLILTFADQTNRTFFLHGGPFPGTIDNLPDELELREQKLPAAADWEEAGRRVATVLGLTASPHLSAASVAKLVADTRAKATELRAACSALVRKLGEHVRRFGLEPGATSREQTALAALRFIEAIHAAKDDDVVPAVARARLATSAATMATSIARAQAVADALNGTKFDLIDAAAGLADERAPAGAAIQQCVREALEKDELAVGLAAALRAAESDAARLLAAAPRAPSPAAPAASATATAPVAPAVAASPPVAAPGRRVVERSKRDDLDPAKAKEVLEAIQRRLRERPGRQLTLEWRIDEPEGERVSVVALSEAQLRAQVKSVRDKVPDARVIGVHAAGPWTGPSVVRVGGEDVEVAFCPSTLALRERLASRSKDAPRLVVVTDRTESELGSDVLARLARRRLYRIDPWRVVLDLFRARELDPRLPRERWLAEALLEAAPPEGYPPAVTAVLDEDTAWGVLLKSRLGLADPQPDARTLLRWTLSSDELGRFEASPAELRAAVAERIGETAGVVGAAIARSMLAGRGRDALPIGLICRVLFGAGADVEPQLREAAVRLEPAVGGRPLAAEAALKWADTAEAVAREMATEDGHGAVSPWLDRAEAILREVRAEDFAHRSPVLGSGFDQRLARFASAAAEVLAGAADVAVLDGPADEALRHDRASSGPDRAERLRMAWRLVRRSRQRREEPGSLGEAALRYAADGGFADWARTRLWDGDGVPAVSDAYGRLSDRLAQEREGENHRFAVLLAEWTVLGSSSDAVIPVEEVLSRVVAPLAQRVPVLLLVADGMSFPVFHELMEDVGRRGWMELAEGENTLRRPALAAIPTVTEVCRASLLCGALRRGPSHAERDGFAGHAGLVAASRSGFPPVLFHKADLVEVGGVGLAAKVRDEIARPARQVVGVVVNAVDDHLAKGDQLRLRWGIDAIRPLGWLLDAARDAGRAVVLTSDHGHVLERDSVYRPRETDSRRYRPDDGTLAGDEVLLRGPRVLSPWGDRIIAPWSERVRYGVKQNGYHGGATPQEVVIPLAVLVTAGQRIPGWSEIAPAVPEWWEIEEPARTAGLQPPLPGPSPSASLPVIARARQDDLVAPPATPMSEAQGGPDVAPEIVALREPPPAEPSWVDRLLASPTYAAQKRLAARPAVEDERVRRCLQAIDARGGKVTRQALARSLGVPPLRLAGVLAALRRLLNVDGYPVLSVDEASDTVELNRALLIAQFEL